jgi:peptidyl-prolyl cis-trans isomerase SDCCAG10
MENENKPNNNRSQFFITLAECRWLDKKHTIFGKVVGDTLYNLRAIGAEETDEAERPINPPKILSVHVVMNPFDDIFPRDLPSKPKAPQRVASGPRPKRPVKYFAPLMDE